MFKLVLDKAEEPEVKLPTSAESSKKQESSRKNIYFCCDHSLFKFWYVHPGVGLLDPMVLLCLVFKKKRHALCIRWPKCWSFSFNISPSSEHPGLISCRMDWLDLLAVQGTLKSLLLSHASKVMLKTLQARLQKYVNREFADVQAGFRKAEESEIKLPNY